MYLSSNSPCTEPLQPDIKTYLDSLKVHSSLESSLIRQEEFVVFWWVFWCGGVICFLTVGFWARSAKGLGDNSDGQIAWQTLKIRRKDFWEGVWYSSFWLPLRAIRQDFLWVESFRSSCRKWPSPKSITPHICFCFCFLFSGARSSKEFMVSTPVQKFIPFAFLSLTIQIRMWNASLWELCA